MVQTEVTHPMHLILTMTDHSPVNSHNLAAGGVHVVKETLQLNGVTTTRELHDLIQSGQPIVLPKNVKGTKRNFGSVIASVFY